MFKAVTVINKSLTSKAIPINNQIRKFLSPAYYCNEVWEHRLNSPVLQRLNLDELYVDVEQRYQKNKQISAVDVDVFVNAIQDDKFNDEVLDLLHKLRLSADTGNTLESTSHAVIRNFLQQGNKEELLKALDDRLNFGLFIDSYMANILLDTFWKEQDYLSGARIASQMMLQEDFDSPLTNSLCLLHCYKYLQDPKEWPKVELPPEPEEEVKVRVKFLRNPFDDEHFDLNDPNKIIGKTLIGLTQGKTDGLNKSFHLLGWILFGKPEKVDAIVAELKDTSLCKEILDLVPEQNEIKRPDIKTESLDVEKLLIANIEKNVNACSEQDIAKQCQNFSKWEESRVEALNEQKKRYETSRRLKTIKDLKAAIKEKETKLWFFENEEQIELDILAKRIYYPKRWFGAKRKPKKIDEGYIPPEIRNRQM